MKLNSNQIQEIIPHRPPFLMIDKVIDIDPGISAVAIKNVTSNDYFFQGHFPQEHIMPGVLMVEALAQTGAVTILIKDEYKGKIVYFAGIDKCKFKRKVVPGDTLRLEAKVISQRGPIGISEAIATVDGEVACTCLIKFAIGK